MKSLFLYFTIICLNSLESKFAYYEKALPLIVNSKEFKEFNVTTKDYCVSTELLSFSVFEFFYRKELKSEVTFDLDAPEIAENEPDLAKLNIRKCGKMKIFFSEQKNGVFFAEILFSKKRKLKYGDRSIFGSTFIYFFKANNEGAISLISVKRIHYN